MRPIERYQWVLDPVCSQQFSLDGAVSWLGCCARERSLVYGRQLPTTLIAAAATAAAATAAAATAAAAAAAAVVVI